MRSRYPGICIALAALILVSCATPTLYAPMDGEFGYADELTGPAKAKVTFYGNAHTPRDTVETYLLYRAAELTIENGYAVFAVRGAQTEAVTQYRANGDGICESLFYHRGFPYSAFGFPWSVQAADPAAQRFEASAHVVFMNGEPAHPGEDTYIADAIIQWLMPCIHRPGERSIDNQGRRNRGDQRRRCNDSEFQLCPAHSDSMRRIRLSSPPLVHKNEPDQHPARAAEPLMWINAS